MIYFQSALTYHFGTATLIYNLIYSFIVVKRFVSGYNRLEIEKYFKSAGFVHYTG